jgi:hypothetical protein
MLGYHFCMADTWSSDKRLLDMNLFGVSKDTISTNIPEQFIVDNVLLMRSRKSKDLHPYRIRPYIEEVYSFEFLPDIRLFHIYTGIVLESGHDEDLFTRIYFNMSDSTIYPYGGSTLSFSNLIREYLPKIIRDSMIVNLLNMYVISLSKKYNYYVILDFSDYEDLWISYNLEIDNIIADYARSGKDSKYIYALLYVEPELIEKDKNVAKTIIGNIDILKIEDGYLACFFTWEDKFGRIEFWRVGILSNKFEIIERSVIRKNMGPFQKW